VDFPSPAPDALARPWRTAAIVASGVAAVELLLLLGAGAILLGRSLEDRVAAAPKKKAKPPAAAAKPEIPKPKPLGKPRLPRGKTSILVLNGNGRTGAAGTEAQIVRARGYAVAGVGNARRTDYTRTLVMFRPGFKPEGVRLARDLGVKIVTPLDGLKPRALHGAQVVVVVGD